jgi:hypothetical protein
VTEAEAVGELDHTVIEAEPWSSKQGGRRAKDLRYRLVAMLGLEPHDLESLVQVGFVLGVCELPRKIDVIPGVIPDGVAFLASSPHQIGPLLRAKPDHEEDGPNLILAQKVKDLRC